MDIEVERIMSNPINNSTIISISDETILAIGKRYFELASGKDEPTKPDEELEHRTVRSEVGLKEIKRTGHNCGTCKYGQKSLTEEPCSSCDIRLGNNKWEPDEDGDK